MLTLGSVTFDTSNALELSRWWADQLGGDIIEENEGNFCVVRCPGFPTRLSFQLVEDPTPGKNRVHLDMMPASGEGGRVAVVEKLVAAGATLVDQQIMGDFAWDVLRDPHGNIFCVSDPELE